MLTILCMLQCNINIYILGSMQQIHNWIFYTVQSLGA